MASACGKCQRVLANFYQSFAGKGWVVNQRFLSSDPIRTGIVGMVGRTPLVRINKISDETGCEILAKAEFCNGGGSVKDRAALFLIRDAEKKGQLGPGGTVVEGTAGNTGIGLAHMCLAMGYKCVIYMPDNQSKEKIDMLKTLGADVRPCPVKPFTDEMNYNHQARRFAESLDNAVWTNQFDNTANRLAHIETTGPEIWNDTKGKVNAIVFGTGTGGTLAGTGIYLKEKNNKVQVVCADPQGSVLYNWFKHGKLERTDGSSITEGIGQGRVTENMKGAPVDDAMCILDKDAVEMTFRLLDEEGLFVGASTGLNVSAAYQLAKQMGPGHTIATCLCDTGQIKRRIKRMSPSALAAYAVQSSSLEHEDHLDVKYISAYKDSRAQVQHQGAQHRDMDPRLQKPSEPTNKPEVMAMTQDELKLVTDHMGHSLAIHTDVYRLQTSVLERTKVARALVALEEGKLTKSNSNQDTNLSTIDLDDLPAPLLQSDDEEEEEEGVQVEDKMEEFTTHNSDINEESPTVTAANTSKGIKRKRWSEKEDADFMEGFGNHIKKKKTVSACEIRAIKSKFMSLKDRSEAVIRARINNICLGKIKCKLNLRI